MGRSPFLRQRLMATLVNVVNPFRFLVGGWPYSLALEVAPGEAMTILGDRTVDTITDFVESALGPRKAKHMLAGSVRADRVYLYTPRYVRWPMWPLSPIFRGTLAVGPAGGSVLTGRMFIRRWRAALTVLIAVALAAFAPWPITFLGYAFAVFAVLQFLFVLQETRVELIGRIEDVCRPLTVACDASKC